MATVAAFTFPGISIGYFRREFPDLEGPGGAIMRSKEILSGIASYHATQHRWTYPTKSILQFCHCKDENDVYGYKSQQFDIVLIDESTEFTRFQYRYLLTRNRATRKGIIPFMALATNPGGPGHGWFRDDFVDAGPFEQVNDVEVEPTIFEKHIFIPAKLSDNLILEKRDPGYRASLAAQSELIRRQLLEGDWDAYAGQYYPEFKRDIHVVKPFDIPEYWKRFRSLDYGLDTTACYWWAVDTHGKCFIYRELHEPNLNLSQAAKKILDMTPSDEKISYTVASPDLWNRRQETGKSGMEIMIQAGLTGLIKANNSRIPGWRALREYLTPYEDEQEIMTANLQIFSHCMNLIKCLPLLQHDETNPEDAADKPHNITHAPESIRYGVASRPNLTFVNNAKPRDTFIYRDNTEVNGYTGGEIPRSYINW